MSAPISSEYICFDLRFSGTSPFTILCAKPSAMAVLPTPGSPIKIGLFLVRLERICSTLRISSSRPITGSSFPDRAASLRFLAYFDNALYVSSELWEVTRCPFRNSAIPARRSFSFTPESFNSLATASEPAKIPSAKCSMDTNSSFISDMS